MSDVSFSLQELVDAGKVDLAPSLYLEAPDGVRLSYRRYASKRPRAALLFYHGGGAHSGAGYQHVGVGLETAFDLAVYTPDLRGHGASGGPRGDAPSPGRVWEDITTFIKRIRADYPDLPVFVGGHSSGGGLILNYAGQPEREPVSGYVFLSPQLGALAQIDRPAQAAPFARVDLAAFAGYFGSGGASHGHDYAVRFNYPAALLAGDPGFVSAITVNMSLALIPSAPREQFAALDCPFGLWIGSEDELFLPDKVLAFADLAVSVRAGSDSCAGAIPGGKHLSVLLKAHETMGPWIIRRILGKSAG